MMVVGCATVAGCSSADGEAAPVVTPVRPTAVTPSPSPTPTRPTGTDDAAAIATAQAYFAAFNEGLKTRNSKALKALTSKACSACASDAKTIDGLAKNDQIVEGGRYIFRIANGQKTAHRQGYIFVAMVTYSEEATVRDASGRQVKHFDAGQPATTFVTLQARGRSLVIVGVGA
jgi:hypothetical protein